jgi:hypothetical protein
MRRPDAPSDKQIASYVAVLDDIAHRAEEAGVLLAFKVAVMDQGARGLNS